MRRRATSVVSPDKVPSPRGVAVSASTSPGLWSQSGVEKLEKRASDALVRGEATNLVTTRNHVISNRACVSRVRLPPVRLPIAPSLTSLASPNLRGARYALPEAMPFCEPEGVIAGAGLVTACE